MPMSYVTRRCHTLCRLCYTAAGQMIMITKTAVPNVQLYTLKAEWKALLQLKLLWA